MYQHKYVKFQCVPTTYVTEIKETYFEMYIYQEPCPLTMPLLNNSICQSVLNIYMTAISPIWIS